MADGAGKQKWTSKPIPPIPEIADDNPIASTLYSKYRTGLSNQRTDMSEHRTALSDERTELSARRTGMSFQRTRMSADRTLMSVIRTSLSLISFGFTIYQVFEKARASDLIERAAAPRNFGTTLVGLGIALLVFGIGYHLQFMVALRREREAMKSEGLIHGESPFPVSLTLITAALLLVVGIIAILSMVFRAGPFG